MAKLLTDFTPEEREQQKKKAAETRARKSAERAASPLRKDFSDEGLWYDVARAQGVEMAPWGDPPTADNIKRYIRKYGISVEEFKDWFGEGDLGSFQRLNPAWPLRALCGMILEGIDAGVIKRDLRGGVAPSEVQTALVF